MLAETHNASRMSVEIHLFMPRFRVDQIIVWTKVLLALLTLFNAILHNVGSYLKKDRTSSNAELDAHHRPNRIIPLFVEPRAGLGAVDSL